MPAYVIVDVEVTDPVAYEEYRKLAPLTLEKYGGTYLARGGETDVKEGDWMPTRFVILEFPSMDQAKRWYASPEYAPALEIRKRASNSKLILAEGLD